MPYRKHGVQRKTPTDNHQSNNRLPGGTRISINLEPSGPPGPFGNELVEGILAGHATLVLESTVPEGKQDEESPLTTDVIESSLRELSHSNAKPSTVRTYTKH